MAKLRGLLKKIMTGKKKYIVIAVVVIAVGMALSQGGTALEVQGTTVDKGTVQRYVEEVGTFEAKTTITVNGRLAGVVETIDKVEGDMVIAGDTLLTMDTRDQLIKIKGTEAEIDVVYAELAEAGRADKNKVSQIKSQIALAQNAYVKDKVTYENNEALYATGAVSKVDRDDSKRTYEDSLQSLRIAQNDLALLTKGISASLKQQYESRIDALTSRLELEKRGLEQMTVKAPIDGIVTDKFVKVGDIVNFGTALVEVSDPNAFHVTSDLLVSDAASAAVGYKVMISDPETDHEWIGQIGKIFPKAFSKTSDLGIEQKRVKVEIDPKDMAFDRFGYEFDIKIIFEEKADILRCKDSAVFQIDGTSYVFKEVDEKAVLTAIEIGLEGEEYVELLSGLSEGDNIVQSPSNELEEGMKVLLK